MGDNWEEGFKNLKKWVTSFMDSPILQIEILPIMSKFQTHSGGMNYYVPKAL